MHEDMIEYPDFNFSVIPKFNISLVIGKRGCGKSKLVFEHAKHISRTRPIDQIHIIDPMPDHIFITELYKTVSKIEVYDNFDNSDLSKIIYKHTNGESILIIDNFISSSIDSDFFNHIIYNNRHLHLTTFIIVQQIHEWRPELLKNIDFFFASGSNFGYSLQQLHHQIFNCLDVSDAEFEEIYQKNTKNFHFLVKAKPVNTMSNIIFSHNCCHLLDTEYIEDTFEDLVDNPIDFPEILMGNLILEMIIIEI